MPKIEIYRDALLRAIGDPSLTDEQLEDIFPAAKAELDEPADDDGVMKVELNDTNRPDLWSTGGLARQLRLYRGEHAPAYGFLSSPGDKVDTGSRRVVVDASVAEVRPYVVGFVMSGRPIDPALLRDLIQTQEKLTWNYGRKRCSIAMGIYRADKIAWPVHYSAVDPDSTRFVPLQMDRELTLREITTEHPKGLEYGHIVADQQRFPLLTDDNGEVLSFPPVINSASLGAVVEGDSRLFVEVTGSDLDSLLHTVSIVACDVADAGYEIEPVTIEYPEETAYGRSFVAPLYFQAEQRVSLAQVNHMLGTSLTHDEVAAALTRMGIASSVDSEQITVTVPPYRNDFLHAVDIVEDVMIGRGMDSFEPEMPAEFTVGRLTPVEEFSRRLRDICVGLGFQQMIFNYLGSSRDYVDRMYPEESRESARARAVRISNPMSENYELVRPSALPSLLSAEAVSANAAYPHHLFEIGKVASRDESTPSGTRTTTVLALVSADRQADFNLVNSHVSAILFYSGRTYSLRESDDPRFLPGRVAEVILEGSSEPVGLFGELHPRVLEAWGVQVPATAVELAIEPLLHGDGWREQ